MTDDASSDRSPSAIRTWLLAQCAEALGVPVDSLNPSAPLETFGLGSVQAVSLVGDLEDRLGRQLPATLFWDYPTLDAVADALAGTQGDGD
jgi:acyl carrier protein